MRRRVTIASRHSAGIRARAHESRANRAATRGDASVRGARPR
jgi:hypothetical protein